MPGACLQGEVVVRQGDPGNVMYFVAEGELEVRLYRKAGSQASQHHQHYSSGRSKHSFAQPGSPGLAAGRHAHLGHEEHRSGDGQHADERRALKASEMPRPRADVELDIETSCLSCESPAARQLCSEPFL